MRTARFLNLSQQSDALADDSDKTFTVPAGKMWDVRSIYAKLVTTATVGNRQLDIVFADASANIIGKYQSAAAVAASLTREWLFAPGNPAENGFTNAWMLRPMSSNVMLPAGYTIRVYDSAAVDAAADDLTVRIIVEELSD